MVEHEFGGIYVQKKYIKLAIGNLLFAIIMVFLYSPGLIGLSFFSDNALMVAAAAAVAVVAILFFILFNKNVLLDKEFDLIEEKEERSLEKAMEVMENYKKSEVLGKAARSSFSQMQRLKTAENNYEKLISRRFQPSSLSYEKFMNVIRSSVAALSSGYIKIANKMVIFEEDEYQKLLGDEYLYDDIPDDIQRERFKLYNKNLNSIKEILEKNEIILLGIDKLMTEISDLESTDNEMNETASEIDSLLNQLEYYK